MLSIAALIRRRKADGEVRPGVGQQPQPHAAAPRPASVPLMPHAELPLPPLGSALSGASTPRLAARLYTAASAERLKVTSLLPPPEYDHPYNGDLIEIFAKNLD